MSAMSWEFLELAVHLDLEILPIETDFEVSTGRGRSTDLLRRM